MQNTNLQAWLDGNKTLLNETQANNIDLTSTLDLGKSMTLVNDVTVGEACGTYTWGYPSNVFSYAGYISVWVLSSTLTNTYVRVIYSSYDVNCNDSVMVGSGGIAVFPVLPASVLPASYVIIIVGNSTNISTNQYLKGATANVTITYYY